MSLSWVAAAFLAGVDFLAGAAFLAGAVFLTVAFSPAEASLPVGDFFATADVAAAAFAGAFFFAAVVAATSEGSFAAADFTAAFGAAVFGADFGDAVFFGEALMAFSVVISALVVIVFVGVAFLLVACVASTPFFGVIATGGDSWLNFAFLDREANAFALANIELPDPPLAAASSE
jgi:hypothetical protein